MPAGTPVHLAAALDGAGWHPAAWRAEGARPRELLTAGYWSALASEAQHGLLDFITIEDAMGLSPGRTDGPDDRTDQVRGRLDAVLIAARVAPLTAGLTQHPGVSALERHRTGVGSKQSRRQPGDGLEAAHPAGSLG